MNCFDDLFGVGPSLTRSVLQPATDNKAVPTAEKSKAIAAPILPTTLSANVSPSIVSLPRSVPSEPSLPMGGLNKPLPASLSANLGNPSMSSNEAKPSYEVLETENRRLKQDFQRQFDVQQKEREEGKLHRQAQFKESLEGILIIANGVKQGSEASEEDDPLSYLKKLSTPQKVWLGGSLVALQMGFSYLTSPAQVAAPTVQSSLLSRIGLTPTNIAIVAVAAVAYKVLKPKVEALTSVYTTWKPRVDAAKSWFNWFSS